MTIQTNTELGGALCDAADRLLVAAMQYFTEYRKAALHGAVVWVTDTEGRMVVLTRGEYRGTLLRNVDSLLDESPVAFDASGAAPADDGKTAVLPSGDVQSEVASLCAFAQDVMTGWPDDIDLDGGYLQDCAVKHGLLKLADPLPTEPCGESCACAEYFGADEWARGVQCYRKTALLTGVASPTKDKP